MKMEALFLRSTKELVCIYQVPISDELKKSITGSDSHKGLWVNFEAMSLADYSRKIGKGSYLSYLEKQARKAARA